ncbi:MAG: hypothetical protein NPIRA06_08540 [Nitrospirales bacterium]|nr:MAG: hypothetical protein NPIRA06_08540 [Nitrospirales bacterium]
MELLDQGERISETDTRGWTALHYAARAGQDTVVNLFLKKGADINAQGNRGETPLLMAAYNCHERVVRVLLKKGANFSIKGIIDSGSYSGSWMTPLLIASGNRCDAIILSDLINAGADPGEIEDKYGWSPLIFAANTGNLPTVKVLLLTDVDVNHQANDGITALIASAGQGSKEVVQILLAAGADMAIRATKLGGPLNKGLEPADTALSVAKRRGHSEVVALLEAAEKKTN